MRPDLQRSLVLAFLTASVVVLAGCGKDPVAQPVAPAAAQSEPPAMDASHARAAGTDLLELNSAGCKRPSAAIATWACSRPEVLTLVSAVNQQRAKVMATLDGSLDHQTWGESTTAFVGKLSSCFQKSDARGSCIVAQYTAHGKEMAEGAGVGADQADVASNAANVAAPSNGPKFGSFEPLDYRSMTVAAYREIHAARLAEAKAHWAQRMAELKVVSECEAPSSKKTLSGSDFAPVRDAIRSCDMKAVQSVFVDGDSIRRDHSAIHGLAILNGCPQVSQWLLSQCVPHVYDRGEPSKPMKPVDWNPNLGLAHAEDDATWTARHAIYPRILDALAVYYASAKDHDYLLSWSPLNEAAQSGEPSAFTFFMATGLPIDAQSDQKPLATAIAEFRVSGCDKPVITSERCAGHFEVIKAIVMLGTDIEREDRAYGTPMRQARSDGAQPIIEFLTWYGAKAPKPEAAPEPVDPVVARCMENVNSTLNTTTGNSIVGLQMEVQRHAQALRECQALGEGVAPEANGALASAALQAEYSRFAKRVAQGEHPTCQLIANDIEGLLMAGGTHSPQIIDLIDTARRYHCENRG